MLDAQLKQQLTDLYRALETPIELVYDSSSHASQSELLALLEELQTINKKIVVKPSGNESPVPRFQLHKEGKPTGISYRGIPGGHEFSSLVLAILNADGKGKLPDNGLASRIRALKGPIRLQTYISLTCENCPDVVQALQQMALLHEDFQHEMIDGAFAQEEIDRLGIQGVPSLIATGKMIHSGRIQFLDLLTKLEEHFGTQDLSANSSPKELGHFDVVVVGGGPAGASAAIYSARKGLRTALIAERIGGQVKDTRGIENLIATVYTEGPELANQLHQHLRSYPIEIFEQRRVTKITKEKQILLDGGESLSGDAIIVASGARWRQLGVPGEKEYLGRGVAYCPHCDGPFYRGKKVVVIGGGNSGVEAAIDLAGIAASVTLFEFNESLRADQVLINKLNSMPNTSVITHARTLELLGDGGKITGIRYLDRKTEKELIQEVDGVFVQIGLLPNSEFLKGTAELTRFGEVQVDLKGHTTAPGIYAAGDVTTVPFKQIVIAMGEGAKVALTAFEDRLYHSAAV